jgi:hypothetical protein
MMRFAVLARGGGETMHAWVFFCDDDEAKGSQLRNCPLGCLRNRNKAQSPYASVVFYDLPRVTECEMG